MNIKQKLFGLRYITKRKFWYELYRIYRPRNGLNTTKRDQKVIVSLTSFPNRFSELHIVIASLLNQVYKPDAVILYLGLDCDNVEIPRKVRNLQQYGLTIKQGYPDLKPHKKYFFAMQEYPNDIIVTVDDDGIYDRKLLSDLMETHEKYPRSVVARRLNEMRFDADGQLLPYNQWIMGKADSIEPDFIYLATGVGGVLYPPRLLPYDMFNQELIEKLCLRTDDLWLKYHELASGVP